MMLKSVVNALLAALYIAFVASLMEVMTKQMGNKPDNILGPIAAMALLTLSVAVMGYLFFLQPMQLYLNGKKKEGLALFVKTLLVFAGLTLLVFAVILLKLFL